MSVQNNQYLCFGYLLPYNRATQLLENKYGEEALDDLFTAYHDSAFNEKIVEVNGFSMIPDVMSGEYLFFGKIFKKSQVYNPLPTTIIPTVSLKTKKALIQEFSTIFEGIEAKPQFLLLNHYR